MAGVVINPVQAPSGHTTSSCGKTFRISKAVDRLFALVRGGLKNDVKEICELCIHLSRGIDSAVSNNEIPERALELPYLLKQVCQWTSDRHLLTAMMVLMISMKGACRNGWFGDKDNEELHKIWTELATSFCSVRDMNYAENAVNHSISTVLSRFYPRMKMGEIFAFIEAAGLLCDFRPKVCFSASGSKSRGYGVFVKDFHITKKAKSPHEEVCLFVAQIDNMETSSCITSPQLVNFLLNGKAVDRRTCIYKDHGPQIPTPITDLVKNGTNLLQAVGQFNGKYIIVVAFMSMITNPSCPALPDYVQPVAVASDLDNDIVEGPSRISLNCPISFKRILTPVKGHLCKHLQCFDFENYVDINSRRPSWRCPHCSQSVCFTDIRIDQVMAKVLKDVGGTVSHVNFSADGSWGTVNECDDHADKQQDKSLPHQQSNPCTNTGGDIMDLTKGDNDIDIDAGNSHQENEKKPSLGQLQNQNECGASDTRSDVAISQGQSQTVMSGFNNMQLPLPTHAIGTSSTVMSPNLQGQSQTQNSAYTMQYQQQNMNSMSNGYGQRYTTPSRQVTRIPIAIQGRPAQTPAGMVNTDRQQQYSRFYMDQYQVMRMNAASNPSVSENMGSQNWVHHGLSNVSSQPAQQFGAHSGPLYQSDGHHFNSHQQQSANLPNLVQSPFLGPAIGQVSNRQAHQYADPTTGSISNQQAHHYVGPTTGSVSNQQTRHYVAPMTGSVSNQLAHPYVNAAASQAFQVTGWTQLTPTPVQTSLSSEEQRGLGQAFRTQEGSALANALADPNWRPSVRMRGSLSGRAYSEAFSQAMVRPTQPAQAASPLVLNTPRPFLPPHLQVLIANTMNANSFQEGAGGSVVDGGGGGVLFP